MIEQLYQTLEGREVLRSLLPILMKHTGYGEQIIAGIIAQSNRNNYEKEVELTRAALRRWLLGQPKLWARDPSKESKCLRRLEEQMMLVPACRKIILQNVSSIKSSKVGSGLGLLIYGAQYHDNNRDVIEREKKKIE